MHRKSSFTLIELLVVIAIVGILAGIIIVSMTNATGQATIAKAKVFANSMRDSMAQSIVSEWNFNNIIDYNSVTKVVGTDAGNIVDSWGANHGTASGGPIIKDENECVIGKCLSFNGTSSYVSVASSKELTARDAITINVWVYERAHKNYAGIVEKGDKYVLLSLPNPPYSYYFILRDVDGTSNYANMKTAIPLNQWVNLTATWNNGSALKIYLNGELDGTGNVLSKQIADTTGGVLRIGEYTNSSYVFNGLIDEVRIYSSALPSAEIKSQYLLGLNSLLIRNKITKNEYNQRIFRTSNNYALKH
jgi:prepilin-type N-terminal cleavage/methylation domain-containing protein